MPWLAAAGGAAGLAGAIIGGNAQKDAASAQSQAIANAMAQASQIIDSIGAPPDLSQKIILNQFAQAGVLTPELEQQVKAGVSNLAQVSTDKATRDTQVKALQQMALRGRAGLTAEERAQYNQARQQTQGDLEAKQQQIQNDMAMRGQTSSGAEMAQRMLASQSSADRASSESDRIQAAASAQALQAIGATSNMAGALNQQDFSQASQKAAAADEMNRFNTQNQMAISQRNVGMQNSAQAANLGEKQQVQDTNTSNANNELYRQNQAKEQMWQDKLSAAKAKIAPITGSVGQQMQAAQNAGNAAANQASGIAGGAASIFGSLANYYAPTPAAAQAPNVAGAASPAGNFGTYDNTNANNSAALQAQFNATQPLKYK